MSVVNWGFDEDGVVKMRRGSEEQGSSAGEIRTWFLRKRVAGVGGRRSATRAWLMTSSLVGVDRCAPLANLLRRLGQGKLKEPELARTLSAFRREGRRIGNWLMYAHPRIGAVFGLHVERKKFEAVTGPTVGEGFLGQRC
jgi:hypothetical protein